MPPSIILLSIDSLRYDCVAFQSRRPHLDALGIRSLPPTPNLDRLMQGAFRFTQAISTAPYTTTSHASILTGRVPPDHGVRSFMTSGLSEDVSSLPEVLEPLGFSGMLMSDTTWLFRTVGLDRGFEGVSESLATARQWWQDNAYRPRLLVLHLMDLHDPYGFRKPSRWLDSSDLLAMNVRWLHEVEQFMGGAFVGATPRPERMDRPRQVMRHVRGLHRHVVSGRDGLALGLRWYLKALERLDAGPLDWIVRWFEDEGVFDQAIVTVFGDHGEGRDPTSSFRLAHSCLMYDDVIRIPLSIRVPGRSGRVIDDQCSSVDIAPTLVELSGGDANWPAPTGGLADSVNGRSLVPLLTGDEMSPRPAYGEFWQRWCGRRNGRIIETLRQRMLRFPDHKYSLIGRRLAYGRELDTLDPHTFMLRLCSELGGHAADDQRRWNPLVWWAACGGRLGRRGLYWLMRHRADAGPIPKASVFDLADDPLELAPRKLDSERPNCDWFERAVALFDELDERARPVTPLRGTRKEMFAVEERLRELGYVE